MQSETTGFTNDKYYRIRSTGANQQPIFLDGLDCAYFIGLFQRHLSRHGRLDNYGRPYKNYGYDIELIAYSLTSNQIDLLMRQTSTGSLSRFMRSILSTYSQYFNKRHNHTGPVFQNRYNAERIKDSQSLQQTSRHIHRGPSNWREYRYSSLNYFLHVRYAEWVHPQRVLELFDNNPNSYLLFVESNNENSN